MIEVLIKQLEQSSLHELELTLGNDSLHLVKASAAPAPIVNTQATVPSQPVTPETAVPTEPEAPTGTAIKAPLVGIVYLSLNLTLIRTLKSARTLTKAMWSASLSR